MVGIDPTKSPAEVYRERIAAGDTPERAKAYVENMRAQIRASTPPSVGEGRSFGAPAAPTRKLGTGFGREVDQMLTVGLGDEIAGLAGGLMNVARGRPYREGYRSARADDAAQREQYADNHGGRKLAAQVLGGAVALPAAATTQAGRVIPALGRIMKQGGATGAAFGAGEAEGGVVNRTFGAGVGGVVGALTGGLFHGVGKGAGFVNNLPTGLRTVLGAGVGGGANTVIDPDHDREAFVKGAAVGGAAVNAPAAVREIVRAAGTRGAPNLGVAGNEAGAVPVGDIVSAVRRGASRLQPDADQAANVKILQTLERGGKNAGDELATMAARTGGKPFALADANERLRDVTRAVGAVSGRGKEEIPSTLVQRLKGQFDRIRNDMFETTGLRREAASKTIDELGTLREKEAEALYAPLQERVVKDSRVANLFQHRAFQKAYGEAQDILDNENALRALRGEPPLADLPSVAEMGEGFPLTLGTLDKVKRGLDDVLGIGRRTGSIGNEKAATLRALKNGFLDVLDEIEPDYKTARGAYAGRSAMIEAAEEGKNFLNASPDELGGMFQRFGDSEKEAYRKTAFDTLLGYGDNVSDRFDLTKRKPFDLDVPNTREKLAFLFEDPKGLEEFKRRLADEVQMAATNPHVLGGSQTAEKLVELANLFEIDPTSLMSGGLKEAGWKLLRGGVDRVRAGSTEQVADAMTPKLLAGAKDPADYARTIAQLQETLERLKQRERPLGAFRRGSAASGASAATRDR